MKKLKAISSKAVKAAIEKAKHYRLLNEPGEAESICLDVLKTAPKNQQAVVTLLLALTDQFSGGYRVSNTTPEDLLPRLRGAYAKHYFAGIICERRGKASLQGGAPGFDVYEWFSEAMKHYEKAEKLRPATNDEALLRWNTCARLIEHHHLTPRSRDEMEAPLE